MPVVAGGFETAMVFALNSDIISKFSLPHFFEKIMVVIRLARGGAKKRPFYRIIASDSRSRRDGRFIERIGTYNPFSAENEKGLNIATDRLAYWQGVGAKLTPAVERLIRENSKQAA